MRKTKPEPHKWAVYEDVRNVVGFFRNKPETRTVIVSRHKTRVAADVACKRGQYVKRL